MCSRIDLSIGVWLRLFFVFYIVLFATESGANCEQKAARLMTLQGSLDVQELGPEQWKPVTPEQDFCPGDRIRTHAQSRATIELNNKTVISLNQQTTIVFSGIKAKAPSWLDLLKGVIYVRSRTPSSLDVRTHFVNAAIRGTEFLVSTDDEQSQVTVLEGVVESFNDKGGVTVTDGQAAIAKAGQAPVRKLLVAPRDAVQWALYYPPVIDLRRLQTQSADPAVREAARRYQNGDSLGALASLETAGHPDPVFQAGLLIGLGRVDEAKPLLDSIPAADPRHAEVLALRSMIALANNDKDQALALAQQATRQRAESPAAWSALSYAKQAEFDLTAALQAAKQATQLDPQNALSHAREAELLASLGHRRESIQAADKASELNPRLARAWAVLGFAKLNEMDYTEAADSFNQAIALDNSDPLPRFGLGLAKIRAGNVEAGTADLELAASLDPNDALTRSYLGKAYYEMKDSKVAATEFEQAKQLDPKDPTPWFYDAIKKQTENRAVEAAKDMRKAIELNGNRAVYRSKLMLDDDLASRGSALGRIYNQVGLQRLGRLESFNSLDNNPANYTAHRLLSDTLLGVPRHEMARVSSLLQAQLLQAINITPLQPQQAENNLLTIQGMGPLDPSMNEFNPLFARNQISLLPSATVGSFNTYGNETVLSGIYNQFSGSLGQMHYASSGFRNNNDIDQNLYSAYLQAQVTPNFNVMAEYRHRDVENGFLPLIFAPTPFELFEQNSYRRKETSDIYRVGGHWSPKLNQSVLATFAYENGSEQVTSSLLPGLSVNNQVGKNNYTGEMQHIFRHDWLDWVIGAGRSEANGQLNTLVNQTTVLPPTEPGGMPTPVNRTLFNSRSLPRTESNGYAYFHVKYPERFNWTLGLSVDALKADEINFNKTLVNPKVGLTWQIFDGTALRMVYFQTLRHVRIGEQTVEPVQVSGFNQLYDDRTGTKATRYGAALDQTITDELWAGAEISQRDLEVPFYLLSVNNNNLEGTSNFSWREQLYHGYIYWTPWDRFSARVEYTYEDFFNSNFNIITASSWPPSTRTHTLPVTLSYFDPTGWFAQAKTTYVNQQVNAYGNEYLQEDFALVDTSLGYRLPKRYGIIQFDIRNLFDQSFRYQSNNLRSQAIEQVPFFPDRAFYGRITLSF